MYNIFIYSYVICMDHVLVSNYGFECSALQLTLVVLQV
jgi:hypothetical protein